MKSLALKLSVKIPSNKIEIEQDLLEERNKSKNECTHIVDNIYLSGYRFSLDYEFLKKNEFTHIINCAAGSKRFNSVVYPKLEYLNLFLKDDPNEDLEHHIVSVIDFMEKANEVKNRKILLHCFEGISRAPTLLTSYLMWNYNLNYESAVKLIRQKRPCVEMNFGFICQLEKLNEKIFLCLQSNKYISIRN